MSSPQSSPTPNPSPAPPIWSAPPAARPGGGVFAAVGIVLAGIVGLLVIAYLALALGVSTLVIGSVLALVPLMIVLLAVRWIDRWEPEPRWALWFAFLWGAAVSVAVALVVDLGVQLALAFAESGRPGEGMQAVVQAPIVEELAKGVGVLLLFAFRRSHFDGPVDGLVYGATVAAGFAFTENVLYFGAALAEGGAAELGTTFVVRGLFSPFAHVLFTACTGLALGIGARRGGRAGVIGWFLGGLVAAVLLHGFWNGSLAFASDAVGLYFTVQVPIFIGFILLTWFLRAEEMRVTRTRLAEYGAAGWFSPAEVEMLATPAGRRQAIAWARSQTPRRTAAMRKMITDATHLALTRHRLVTGRGGSRDAADERALLTAVTADRAALLR
ncbi:PrsW family intramembrane metalloprotease [Agromyces sp. H66]|uniref:PrsW family intramembrane metalloprotease n=1 Tax=Agromyces sp. H66 TaxID=2529859 RepID=UPI0020C00207|nr:PrsW family intramembrane metalloprotease [Agromyces sp. H66]